MTPPKPFVIVDSREPESTLSRVQAYGLDAAVALLPAGDYAFFPHKMRVLIERKTISDLLSSLSSKRLVTQVHRMLGESDLSILLREGAHRRGPNGRVEFYSPRHPDAGDDGFVVSGWNWESYSGMMLDLSLLGLVIHDCPVLGEYPAEVARIVTALSKDEHRWIQERERPQVTSFDSQYKNHIWALCAFDGIGPEWAEAMDKVFGTFKEVVNADMETLSQVRGAKGRRFGMKNAEKVVRQWEEKWN